MAVPDSLTELQAERLRLTCALTAHNTQSGYRFDQAVFARWTAQMGFQALPATADTLSLWVTSMLLRGLKVSTCGRRVAAVAYWHRSNGYPSPATDDIRNLLRGARRQRAEQVRRVLPLAIEELRAISILLLKDDTPVSVRNWAMLLTGFAGALRNSNAAALLLSDLEFSDKGATLNIRRSKTDQEGRRAQLIGLHHAKHPETCPVIALRKWIGRRGAWPGPLFSRFDGGVKESALLPERIGQIVQACIRRIGLDSRLYGGHSLRSAFVTEAGLHGASELLIAATTGHTDMSTLRQYFRRRDVFAGNALGLVDL